MDLQLTGKVAVVTGADSGMGLATARVLAEHGATVVLNDLDQTALDARAKEIDGQTIALAADLNEPSEVERLAATTREKVGPAHILAHFAGTSGASGDFLTLTDDDWLKTITIDLMAAVRVARAFIPHMLEHHWGRVLFVASENAVQPYPDETPYSACKAAVLNLSKGLSKAYATRGILVNTISPAFVETPMTDAMMQKLSKEKGISFDEAVEWFLKHKRPTIEVNRRGQVDEIAPIAAFLCSPLSSYVNGANWRIDGGSVESI